MPKSAYQCPLSLKALECQWFRRLTIAAVSVLVSAQVILLLKRMKQKQLLASFNKKDVVYFLHLPRCESLNHISPPCMKLDVFLRLAKIPHVGYATFDTSISPSGRLPCIVYNGEVVCDSEVIINFLLKKQPERCKVLLEGLTPEQHGQGTMIRRVCESSLLILGERFWFVNNPAVMKTIYVRDFKLHPILASLFVKVVRRGIIQWLNAHGNGDVPDDQCAIDAVNDVRALEMLLTKHSFAVADRPTVYDAPLYAIVNLLVSHVENDCRGMVYDVLKAECPAILSYNDRMKNMLYGDLKAICSDGKSTHEYFTS